MASIDADLQAAFDYTFPLYEMARTRYLAVEFAANPNRGAINRLAHRRSLSDAGSRAVTTPNNDTLYSSAWLDLSAGPLLVTIPKIANRYWSFQFMDAYTSTAELIGSRNAGDGDLTLWVAHADDPTPAPTGVRVLRLPTRDGWMLVRILVDGADDARLVHKLQDAITLRVLKPDASAAVLPHPPAPNTPMGSPTDGGNYLNTVNSMLARNPVRAVNGIFASWQRTGVQQGASASEAQAKSWSDALPGLTQGLKSGRTAGVSMVQGWQYPPAGVGTYTENSSEVYRLRAATALGGLGALPTEEAIYLSAISDGENRPLTGQSRYRVKIPSGGIPAKAFWSLSMYQVESDGRLFFTHNPANRYAVGDRTAGLQKNADGSINIVVQTDAPAEPVEKANWLPAPNGPFRMVLRAYLPSPELMQGKVTLPILERRE